MCLCHPQSAVCNIIVMFLPAAVQQLCKHSIRMTTMLYSSLPLCPSIYLFPVVFSTYYLSRDNLLLETGFLCILVAPLTLIRGSRGVREHDRVTFWLIRWLLFRLMFASGVVKLTSRCPTWWGLTGVCEYKYLLQDYLSCLAFAFVSEHQDLAWLPFHSMIFFFTNSSDLPLRDSVYPHPAGLVCPPVSSVVAEAERDGDLHHRDRCTPAFLQPTAQTPARVFLPAGG